VVEGLFQTAEEKEEEYYRLDQHARFAFFVLIGW
jgi:hypothetical protein